MRYLGENEQQARAGEREADFRAGKFWLMTHVHYRAFMLLELEANNTAVQVSCVSIVIE